MSEQKKFYCTCGKDLTDLVDYSNGTNEEGEEYSEINAYCDVCKKDYQASTWGYCDNTEEAVDILINELR